MNRADFDNLRYGDLIKYEGDVYMIVKAPNEKPPYQSRNADEVEIYWNGKGYYSRYTWPAWAKAVKLLSMERASHE